jgi:hypothetical protein
LFQDKQFHGQSVAVDMAEEIRNLAELDLIVHLELLLLTVEARAEMIVQHPVSPGKVVTDPAAADNIVDLERQVVNLVFRQ